MELVKQLGKLKFTASDIENNLYELAVQALDKTSDPQKFANSIAAYNAIIRLEGLRLKAQIMSRGIKVKK